MDVLDETPEYHARLRALQPFITPGAFFFTGEDHLRLTSFNSSASVALSVEGRFLALDGRIESFVERHVPATDRTSATSNFPRGAGWLLNVQVRASGDTPRRANPKGTYWIRTESAPSLRAAPATSPGWRPVRQRSGARSAGSPRRPRTSGRAPRVSSARASTKVWSATPPGHGGRCGQ